MVFNQVSQEISRLLWVLLGYVCLVKNSDHFLGPKRRVIRPKPRVVHVFPRLTSFFMYALRVLQLVYRIVLVCCN